MLRCARCRAAAGPASSSRPLPQRGLTFCATACLTHTGHRVTTLFRACSGCLRPNPLPGCSPGLPHQARRSRLTARPCGAALPLPGADDAVRFCHGRRIDAGPGAGGREVERDPRLGRVVARSGFERTGGHGDALPAHHSGGHSRLHISAGVLGADATSVEGIVSMRVITGVDGAQARLRPTAAATSRGQACAESERVLRCHAMRRSQSSDGSGTGQRASPAAPAQFSASRRGSAETARPGSAAWCGRHDGCARRPAAVRPGARTARPAPIAGWPIPIRRKAAVTLRSATRMSRATSRFRSKCRKLSKELGSHAIIGASSKNGGAGPGTRRWRAASSADGRSPLVVGRHR